MNKGKQLSHLDEDGAARMVDVGGKDTTVRRALAEATLCCNEQAFLALMEGSKKGDALQVARIAAIQAAKRTADLIPLCHPLALDAVSVDFRPDSVKKTIVIQVSVSCTGRTGVEMEALCGASAGALTLYDMGKAVDRGMVIEGVRLLEKDGGQSGPYRRT